MTSNLLARNNFSNAVFLSRTQFKLDAMTQVLAHESANVGNVMAMTLGSGAFRLLRAGSLSLFAGTASRTLNGISYLSSVGAEVTVYRSTHRLLDEWTGKVPRENLFHSSTWSQNFADFLTFKALGRGLKKQSLFLTHTLQSSVLVGTRQVQAHFGFGNKPQTSLVEQWFEAEVMGLAQFAGHRLFSLATANRFEIYERNLECGIQIFLHSRMNAPRSAGLTVTAPAMHATKTLATPGLLPVNSPEDIFPAYRDTPIGRLLEYHNLNRPHDHYAQAALLVGMCMDHRKSLRIPERFAYVLRRAGADTRETTFDMAVAIAVAGIRNIALIGHSQCAMENLTTRKEAFIDGLVQNAGWSRGRAEQYFLDHLHHRDVGNAAQFISLEATRLQQRFPAVQLAPLFYKVEDNRLYQLSE